MPAKIGFIGLGIMGAPMAANILKAGYDLIVYNRTTEKTAPLAELGAKTASAPKEIAEQCEYIILMLSDPGAIEDIMGGEEGLLATGGKLLRDKVLVNMGTNSYIYTTKLFGTLKRCSATFIDAPVSGSKNRAEEGKLLILASGPEDKIELAKPLLLTMGSKIIRCGNEGRGTQMKIVVNLLAGVMMGGLCEAVNLGERSGLSAEAIMEVLLSGPLSCELFNTKKEMMESGEFPPQFPLKHMRKDMAFVVQAVSAAKTVSPLSRAMQGLCHRGVTYKLGDMDFAAVKKVLDIMSVH